MDPTLMEFYMGELEAALAEVEKNDHALEYDDTYSLQIAARNVIRVWDQLNEKVPE